MADQSTFNDDDGEQGAWARPVSARLGEMIIAIGLLATGLFFIWQSALLPFGKVGLPGPGFFPFALGAILALLALLILFDTWRKTNLGEIIFVGHRDVLIALVALCGVAFAFEKADSYVVLGVFTAAMLLLIARASLWRVVAGAIVGMVAVWLFFGIALGVQMPVSDLWRDVLAPVLATPPVEDDQSADQPSSDQPSVGQQ